MRYRVTLTLLFLQPLLFLTMITGHAQGSCPVFASGISTLALDSIASDAVRFHWSRSSVAVMYLWGITDDSTKAPAKPVGAVDTAVTATLGLIPGNTYYIYVWATNAANCLSTPVIQSFTLAGCSALAPQIAIAGGGVCNWSAYGFRILNPDSGQSYTWYYDSTVELANEPGDLGPSQYYSMTFVPVTGHSSFHVLARSVCGAEAVSNILYINSSASGTPPVIQSSTGSFTICGPNPLLLNSSSPTGNRWLNNGVLVDSTVASFVVTRPGAYRLVVTNGGGCVDTSAVQVVTADPGPLTPIVSSSGPTEICSGSSVTLTSSSDIDNQWISNNVAIPGQTGSDYLVDSAGKYWVQVTDDQGCRALSNVVTVTVSTNGSGQTVLPMVSPAGPLTLCTDTAVWLVSTPAVNFQWSINGYAMPGANGDSLLVTQSGSYTVATGTAGCGSVGGSSDSVQVIYLGTVVPIISVDNGVLQSDFPSGNQWYLNGNAIRGATKQVYTPQAPGSYSVKVDYGVQAVDTTNFQIGVGGCSSQFSLPYVVTDSSLESPQVLIYPNPVREVLTLSNHRPGPVTVRIFDMMGRALMEVQGMTGTVQLDVHLWGKGTYIAQVTDQATQQQEKTVLLKL